MDTLVQAVLDDHGASSDGQGMWAVFADHLQRAGDVRGELWTLEQSLARGHGLQSVALEHQRNRILSAHVAEWVGPLIAELDRDPEHPGAYSHELRALHGQRESWSQLTYLPRLFRRQHSELQLGWCAGFIVAAGVRGLGTRAGVLLERLLACPAAVLLACLDFDFDVELHEDLAGLRAPNRLRSLRSLRLSCLGNTLWPASWLNASAPNLRRLWLDNPECSGLEHPLLRRLRVGGHRADHVLGSLGRARLPALEHLTIDDFDVMARTPEDIVDFLGARAMPTLTTVRLGDLRVADALGFLDALMGSRLLAQLRALELERPAGHMAGDATGHTAVRRWLAHHGAAFAHLSVSDIRESSEPFCARL